MTNSTVPDLSDLVEGRFVRKDKGGNDVYQIYCTHHYNIPKAMAYGLKKNLQSIHGIRRAVVYKVVPNGKYQHTNEFIIKKKKQQN